MSTAGGKAAGVNPWQAVEAIVNPAPGFQPSSNKADPSDSSIVPFTARPAEVLWPAGNGTRIVRLTNNSTEHVAVKIRCSHNNVFQIDPIQKIAELSVPAKMVLQIFPILKNGKPLRSLLLLHSLAKSALTVDPPAAAVPAAGGASVHQLANPGAARLVFKVKSSNNNDHRLKPVFGFVEPGAAAPLEITRLAGAPKQDKLVIQYAEAPADAADATAAFKAAAVAFEVTLPVTAE